jgi:hypothetical protein
MGNAFAAPVQDTGSLLMSLAGDSGRSSGNEGGGDFLAIIQSVMAAQPNDAARASPVSTTREDAASPPRRDILAGKMCETDDAPELSPQEAAVALERLSILTRDGSIDTEEVAELSEEEFGELVAWLLAGAGGLFPPAPEFGGENLFPMEGVAGPAAVLPAELAPEEAMQNLMDAAAELMAGEGEGLLESFGGLDSLTEAEKAALSEALAKALARLEGHAWSAETARLNSGGKPFDMQVLAEEVLPQLDRDELAALLAEAASEAGIESEALTRQALAEIPEVVLRAVTEEALGQSAGSGDLLAELAMRVGRPQWADAGTDGETSLSASDPESLDSSSPGIDASTDSGLSGSDADEEGSEILSASDADPEGDPEAARAAGSFLDQKDVPVPEGSGGDAPKQVASAGPQAGEIIAPEAALPEQAPEETVQALVPGDVRVEIESLASSAGEGVEAVPAPDAPAAPAEMARPGQVLAPAAPKYVESMENLDRIQQALRLSVQRGVSSATLQLSPPELGSVRMRVSVQGGVVSATIETQTNEARNVLMSHLPQLRNSMEAHGLRIGEFEINNFSSEDSASHSAPQDDGNRSRQRRGGGQFSNPSVEDPGGDEPAVEYAAPGRLNMFA